MRARGRRPTGSTVVAAALLAGLAAMATAWATATATASGVAAAAGARSDVNRGRSGGGDAPVAQLARPLATPVDGVSAVALRDSFEDTRGGRRHQAIDIPAARGTPVRAVDDGQVVKLFTSVPGGLTVYQFDPSGRVAYYYAHLDRYAAGLREGRRVRRCEILGYVGSTGNAAADAPHLHFAAFALGPERQWWKGVALNPYPAMTQAGAPACPTAKAAS